MIRIKYSLLLLLVACSLIVYGQDKSYDYCYTNNKGLCVYSVADKVEQVIVKNDMGGAISPDGKKVVYNTYTSDGKEGHIIAMMDLNTSKEVLLNTGSINCGGPLWSPDGKMIVYNVFDEQKGKWDIAVMNANNTASPTILTGNVANCYLSSWQAGSKSVVVQDIDKLYVLDMSGTIITTYKIADLMDKKVDGADSRDMFKFTDDNKKIVFTIHMDEPGGNDVPVSAVYVYDIDNRSTLRLSPKEYYVSGLAIKNNQVLFTALKLKSPVQNIYTIDMDGKNLKLLFKNCWGISAKE